MKFDLKKAVHPDQLEKPYEHPVVMQAAMIVTKDPSLSVEVAEVENDILLAMNEYSSTACVLGLLDALCIVVGNIEYQVRKANLKVVGKEK